MNHIQSRRGSWFATVFARTSARTSARLSADHGSVLVYALMFMSAFAVIVIGLLTMAASGFTGARVERTVQANEYAIDGALDGAINFVKWSPDLGWDPQLYGKDPALRKANIPPCIFTSPRQGDSPAVTVNCEGVEFSNSGRPGELGTVPDQAILTLGQRVQEPQPRSDNIPDGVMCGSEDESEKGILFERLMFYDLKVDPLKCAPEAEKTKWTVAGPIFSNSEVKFEAGSEVTATNSTISARGGCLGSSPTPACTDPGWTDHAVGKDPDYDSRALSASGGLDWTIRGDSQVPQAGGTGVPAQCASSPKLIEFEPGVYTDAKRLNDLFADPECRGAIFWFKPGVYYFNFEAGTTADSGICGPADRHGYTVQADKTRHEWCVGPAENSDQHVIGGTPYGWAPTAIGMITELGAARANSPWTTTFWPFDNLDGARVEGDDSVATAYPPSDLILIKAIRRILEGGNPEALIASRLELTDFGIPGKPVTERKVPHGEYKDPKDIEITYEVSNESQVYNPLVKVHWDGEFGGDCGPYTLPTKPTSMQAVHLAAVDQEALGRCLDTGDKINSAELAIEVTRKFTWATLICEFTGGCPNVKIDSVKLLPQIASIPQFPEKRPSGDDPGGDCDPRGEGVQFIFGGESRLYVSDGSVELCAGPDPQNPPGNPQVAIYGVPACDVGNGFDYFDQDGQDAKGDGKVCDGGVPELRSTSRVIANSLTSSSDLDNAKQIAEPSGLGNANITYGLPNDEGKKCPNPWRLLLQRFRACTMLAEGAAKFHFPGYDAPENFDIKNVQLRASYDNNGLATPQYRIGNCESHDMPAGFDQQSQLGPPLNNCELNEIKNTTNGFDVTWTARGTFACVQQESWTGFGPNLLDPNDDTWAWGWGICRGLVDMSYWNSIDDNCVKNFDFLKCIAAGWDFFTKAILPTSYIDQLDGIELIPTLKPKDGWLANKALNPQSGCITALPNYWDGFGDNDCAVLKVDTGYKYVWDLEKLKYSKAVTHRGRLSIKGTTYAPSAAVSIHDDDVNYTMFTRGLIARHFQLRSLAYRGGEQIPIASNQINRTESPRYINFLACLSTAQGNDPRRCDTGDTIAARASVEYSTSADGYKPRVKRWIMYN